MRTFESIAESASSRASIPYIPRGYDVRASRGTVQVGIYDMEGRLVRSLVDGPGTPGERGAVWDGRDDRGHRLAAGVYLCRMRAPGFSQVQKLLLAR